MENLNLEHLENLILTEIIKSGIFIENHKKLTDAIKAGVKEFYEKNTKKTKTN